MERTLNERGERNAAAMAVAFGEHFSMPELVICSPSRRTMATLSILNEAFKLPQESVRIDSGIYEAHHEDLLRVIASVSSDVKVMAMIGHNPGLSILCGMMCPNRSEEGLPTLGTMEIELDLEDWGMIRGGVQGRCVAFKTPKTLTPC